MNQAVLCHVSILHKAKILPIQAPSRPTAPGDKRGAPTVTRADGFSAPPVTRAHVQMHAHTVRSDYMFLKISLKMWFPQHEVGWCVRAHTVRFDCIGNFPRVPGRMLDPGARQRPPTPQNLRTPRRHWRTLPSKRRCVTPPAKHIVITQANLKIFNSKHHRQSRGNQSFAYGRTRCRERKIYSTPPPGMGGGGGAAK